MELLFCRKQIGASELSNQSSAICFFNSICFIALLQHDSKENDYGGKNTNAI